MSATLTDPTAIEMCPICERISDQVDSIPCSMCMDSFCPVCCEAQPDGDDGMCAQCFAEMEFAERSCTG